MAHSYTCAPKEFRMTTSQGVSANELRDFVDLNSARRLEAAETVTPAQIEALSRYWPDAASIQIAGGTAIFAGRTYPANHVVGLGLYGPVTGADLDRVENFYRSRGVACEIVVSPLADASLRELLAPRGYRITEFNSVLIRRLQSGRLDEPKHGITLERVTPETEKVWSDVITLGFAESGPLPDNIFAPLALLPDAINLLARVNGVPAGGGSAYIIREAGVVALFGASTIPEFRRRGVQTALINRRLWEAGQSGCEYAVVSTLPGSGSQRNMERHGFRVAYTKIVMVRSWPESAPSGVGRES